MPNTFQGAKSGEMKVVTTSTVNTASQAVKFLSVTAVIIFFTFQRLLVKETVSLDTNLLFYYVSFLPVIIEEQSSVIDESVPSRRGSACAKTSGPRQ